VPCSPAGVPCAEKASTQPIIFIVLTAHQFCCVIELAHRIK